MPVRAVSTSLSPDRGAQFDAPQVVPYQGAAGDTLKNIGEGLSAVGDATLRIAQSRQEEARRLQEENDANAVKQASLAAADAIRRVAYEDDGGYLNAEGQDAVDRRQAAEQRLTERLREIGARMKTTGQRNAWGLVQQQKLLDARSDFDRHHARQLHGVSVATSEATLKLHAQDYAKAALDPEKHDEAAVKFGAAENEARELARLNGYTGPQTELLLRSVRSGMHVSALDAMLRSEQGAAATKYLADVGDEMDPNARAEMQDRVKRRSDDDAATALADDLVNRHADLREQLARVREMHQQGKITLEVRKGAEARLEHYDSVYRQQDAIEKNQVLDDAQTWLTTNRQAPYELLPDQTRRRLEMLGLDGKVKNWIANDRKSVTTDLGMQAYLALRAKPDVLRKYGWPELYEKMRSEWDDRTLGSVADMWAEQNQAPRPKAVSSDRIHDFAMKSLYSQGILDFTRTLTPEETTRAKWYVDAVEERIRDQFPGGIPDQGSAQVEAALGKIVLEESQSKLLSPSAKVAGASRPIPISMLTPSEAKTGIAVAATGESYPVQTLLGSGQPDAALDEAVRQIQQQNEQIVARNRTRAKGADPEALLSPDDPSVRATFYAKAQRDRSSALQQALQTPNLVSNVPSWLLTPEDKFGIGNLTPTMRARLEDLNLFDEFAAQVKAQQAAIDARHDLRSQYPGGQTLQSALRGR